MLIKPYVQYLKAKIDFHRLYPLFNGVFDFDEYVKNKAIDNLDEAYQTITDLSLLMNHLDQLSRSIIQQFRGGSDNECRQAALIPLVLESHGMYKFMTNLLSVLLESK
jgi:huntingtin-interacting protein 1-related protein